jgi:hypothetical protein
MADAARAMRRREIHAPVLWPHRRQSGGVRQRRRGVVGVARRHLKRDAVAGVVRRSQNAVGAQHDLAVLAQLGADFLQLLGAVDAPDDFARVGLSSDRHGQRAIAGIAQHEVGAVERFERCAACALLDLRQSEVAQETLRRIHLFDAEDDPVDSADCHDCSPCERFSVRTRAPIAGGRNC